MHSKEFYISKKKVKYEFTRWQMTISAKGTRPNDNNNYNRWKLQFVTSPFNSKNKHGVACDQNKLSHGIKTGNSNEMDEYSLFYDVMFVIIRLMLENGRLYSCLNKDINAKCLKKKNVLNTT